jgi:hypothetical protein
MRMTALPAGETNVEIARRTPLSTSPLHVASCGRYHIGSLPLHDTTMSLSTSTNRSPGPSTGSIVTSTDGNGR